MTDRNDASPPGTPGGTVGENRLGQRRPEASRRFRPVVEDAPLPEKVQPSPSRRLSVLRPSEVPAPPPTALPEEWLPPKAPTPQERMASQRFESRPAAPAVDDVADVAPPRPTISLATGLVALARRPGIVAGAAAAGMLVVLVGLFSLTVGGDDAAVVVGSARFSTAEQAALAAAWKANGVTAWGGAHPDAAIAAHVNAVGARIAAATDAVFDDGVTRPMPVIVVKDTVSLQAFGLPDDTIVVTAGLLWHLRTDVELAGLLAHTMVHQRLGHTAAALDAPPEAATRALAALAAPTAPTSKDVLVAVAAAGSTAVNTIDVEAAVDARAIEVLAAAGYDPAGIHAVMSRLVALGGRVAWLTQHPHATTRLEALKPGPDVVAAAPAAPADGYTANVFAHLDRKRTLEPATPATPTATAATEVPVVPVVDVAPATPKSPATPKTTPKKRGARTKPGTRPTP